MSKDSHSPFYVASILFQSGSKPDTPFSIDRNSQESSFVALPCRSFPAAREFAYQMVWTRLLLYQMTTWDAIMWSHRALFLSQVEADGNTMHRILMSYYLLRKLINVARTRSILNTCNKNKNLAWAFWRNKIFLEDAAERLYSTSSYPNVD